MHPSRLPEMPVPEPPGPAGEVVISGMSGRFPECDSVQEFADQLFAGVDLVTEDDRRWPTGLYGVPARSGKLRDVSRFDAPFFGVHAKQARAMDPQLRLLLEVTYEAIVDAGLNPAELRGSRTGVFVGASNNEADTYWTSSSQVADHLELRQDSGDNLLGHSVTGCWRAMFANRLSFAFDWHGPSLALDTACSSGMVALDQAVGAMLRGECDAALVAASNLLLRPATSLQLQRLGLIGAEGKCRAFDANPNGYVRSEAVVAVLLQRAPIARRVYATVLGTGNCSDGAKEEGIGFPSGDSQAGLARRVCAQAGVDPRKDVTYFEAHGTGTRVGDPEEAGGIAAVFCGGAAEAASCRRDSPLPIGSVKSNMGHAEAASGLVSVVKVLVSMERGELPANLHFHQPNQNIPALHDGRLRVVDRNLVWGGGVAGINSMGFGGSNAHVLLRSNPSQGSRSAQQSVGVRHPESADSQIPVIPRVMVVSGRTQDAVDHLLDEVEARFDDDEFLALLAAVHRLDVKGHSYRGYTVLGGAAGGPSGMRESRAWPGARPVWLVFPGMGSQWPGAARSMMRLSPFAEAVGRCAAALKPYGVDLVDVLVNPAALEQDDNEADVLTRVFVSITTVQVALVDTLRALGIRFDGILGHSAGELGCAYADGALSAEQTVLAAYWRGRCAREAALPPGRMAAIGLSWEEVKRRCPPDVFPACHNAADSVTVSGPPESVSAFVAHLKEEGVFAKEVDSCGVAFHSPYVAGAAPGLRERLKELLPPGTAGPRSPRWISTSIPEEDWGSPLARSASAAYLMHNVLSPVLFAEALTKVPDGAILLEVAPHHLMQAVLRRAKGPGVSYVGLMEKDHPDNLAFFMDAVGKLYNAGAQPQTARLLPAVVFPVSRGTPSLASMIRWDHSVQWEVPSFCGGEDSLGGQGAVFHVDVSKDADKYLVGHSIDGRVIFPASGYLFLVWKTYARMHRKCVDDFAVVMEDVRFHRATILPRGSQNTSIKLYVTVMEGTGRFEVREGGSVAASGRISVPEDADKESIKDSLQSLPGDGYDGEPQQLPLDSADVYKELRLRGFEYSGAFCGILHWTLSDRSGAYRARLRWGAGGEPPSQGGGGQQPPGSEDIKWVPFMDLMLQMIALAKPGRDLVMPIALRKLVLDPGRHRRIVEGLSPSNAGVPVLYDCDVDLIRAGGVEIRGVKSSLAQRRKMGQAAPTLEKYVFVPYAHSHALDRDDSSRSRQAALAVVLQIATENLHVPRVKIVEVSREGRPREELLAPSIAGIAEKEPLLLADVTVVVVPVDRDLEPEAVSPLTEWLAERRVKTQLMASRAVDDAISVLGPSELTHLLVQSNDSARKNGDVLAWRNFADSVHPGGFVLLDDEEEVVLDALPPGLVLVAEQPFFDEGMNRRKFVLLRKQLGRVADADPQPVVVRVTQRHFGWVELLKAALGLWPQGQGDSSPAGGAAVVLVSQREDSDSGVLGLATCLRRELGGRAGSVQAVLIQDPEAPTFNRGAPLYAEQLAKGLTVNVLRAGRVWGSYRHLPVETALSALLEVEHAYLDTLVRGDLSSLRWIEAPPMTALTAMMPLLEEVTSQPTLRGEKAHRRNKSLSCRSSHHELCSVNFAALNFRDIMLASGKLSQDALPGRQDCVLGLEFSGRNSTGRRVMGMVPGRSLATAVMADPAFLWEVPDTWTLEEAATVPVCYSTAYYALAVRGRMRRGEAVLIHSGTGGVGQAAIALALGSGCTVFTTVGSREKRHFLLRAFPRLAECGGQRVIVRAPDPDCKLGCFPSACSFEEHVLSGTRGRGVDLVLNSLAGEALLASARCLARHGRFLEIGKVDLAADSPLGMGLFLRNSSFHGILVDALLDGDDARLDREEVSRLVGEGVRSGVVRPLPVTVFRAQEAERAFRFMASGKHIGKVILQVRGKKEEDPKIVTMRTTSSTMTSLSGVVVPRTYMHPHKTYVLVGGLGGLGLELADWLVLRGARRLVLASRSGLRSGYQALRVRRWREEAGVDVLVWSGGGNKGCETERGASELLAGASRMGPVGGIFNLAAVLRDAYLENLTEEDFTAVSLSKIRCTAALDRASRELCPELDHFVCFSSLTSGRGNAGQCNYGLANSAMERLCEARQEAGLPGVAIQWGAVGDVGLVVDTIVSKGINGEEVEVGGTVPQRIASCLAALDAFLRLPRPPAVLSSMVPAAKDRQKQQSGGSVTALEAVAEILGITNVETTSSSQTLADLGLDSIMVTEAKQVLERSYDIFLSPQEIRRLTLGKLGSLSESVAHSRISEVASR